MDRDEVVKTIEAMGWASTGPAKPSENGSLYEQFDRAGRESLWVGEWYIESERYGFAFPYAEDRMVEADLTSFIMRGVINEP